MAGKWQGDVIKRICKIINNIREYSLVPRKRRVVDVAGWQMDFIVSEA